MPVPSGRSRPERRWGTTTRDWWPNQLRVDLLNQLLIVLTHWVRTLTTAKNSANRLLRSEKRSESPADRISAVVPADWGSYAGLFIRMAWHGAVLTVQSTGAAARVVVSNVLHAELLAG